MMETLSEIARKFGCVLAWIEQYEQYPKPIA
jgi:hypothetical protein